MGNCGFTINSLYNIGYCFFGIIDRVIIKQILKKPNKDYDKDYISKFSALILIMYLSEFLISLIFLFFSSFCLKNGNEETEEKKNSINRRNTQVNLINNENNEDNNCWNWKIPLISIVDVCAFIPLIFNNQDFKIKLDFSLNAILLISTTLFTVFYLNYSIYIHHIIGIILIIIGYLCHDYSEIDNLFTKHFSILNVILIILQIPYSLKEIFEKELIEINFFNIYKLLLYEGIFGCLFIILFITLSNKWFIIKDHFSDWLNNEDIYFIIFFTISCGLFNIFRLKINQNYGPIQKYIGNIFIFLFVWIIIIVYFHEEEEKTIFQIVCFIAIIFGGILYTEIINFNFLCCSDFQKNKNKRANEKFGDNFTQEE